MQCWSCSYTSWQWRLWRARRAECDWVGCGSSSTGVAAASVALPMKFSSVSRLLLHWPAHWHHRDPGTLLYWCWDTGHWSPHRPGPPPGAAATLPTPCWGWLGEARQCPLYPVSRSASRCGGGRCGVLRSIHYTVIGMQGGAGPAPTQLATLLPPSQQPQTHLSLSTCCVHCHWSPAQELSSSGPWEEVIYSLIYCYWNHFSISMIHGGH